MTCAGGACEVRLSRALCNTRFVPLLRACTRSLPLTTVTVTSFELAGPDGALVAIVDIAASAITNSVRNGNLLIFISLSASASRGPRLSTAIRRREREQPEAHVQGPAHA